MFSPNSRPYSCSSTMGQALYSGTRDTENKNAVKKFIFRSLFGPSFILSPNYGEAKFVHHHVSSCLFKPDLFGNELLGFLQNLSSLFTHPYGVPFRSAIS